MSIIKLIGRSEELDGADIGAREGELSALLAEYRSVLLRPKLLALLTEITLNALWREPVAEGNAPDSGDDHLWALLDHEPKAILITGNQRLLKEPHDQAMIMTPAAFQSIVPGVAFELNCATF